MQIDIATDISTTGMQLLWTVPMSTMLLESMQNILLPLLLNIGLLALALFGFTTFRHYKGRSHSSGPGSPPPPTANCACCAPLTKRLFLCCRWGCSFTIRKPTERLSAIQLPTICFRTLNLQNITTMADQHQGVIQATVNNEQYEIRQYRSQVAPRTQILIIRDQDREVLVNKKAQKQAQRLYERKPAGTGRLYAAHRQRSEAARADAGGRGGGAQ